ncbi:MAG: sensor histidine kinase [Vulcanimicrobiota bacterium]
MTYVSPAIDRLGLTAEWLRGQPLPEQVDRDDTESLRLSLARARENPDQTFSLDFRLGDRFLQAVVSADVQGGLVLNSRDLTERRRLSQLEHEKKALEATTRARTGFLAHVTHELRTPMSSTLGFTEMLLVDLPERDRDCLETIDRNAKHLLKLIEGILEPGKLEAGGAKICREEWSRIPASG